MRHLRTYESFSDFIQDIKDTLLGLKDDGFIVKYENFNINSDYTFTDEFFIFKSGKSGYYLDSTECGLFKINDIIDDIIRFTKVCDYYDQKYRVITSDGQYTLDITKKVNELDKVDKSDILETTHLHLKKSSGKSDIIDLDNVKFVSCLVLK